MKQIIPFKKELLFKTKVSEITSISLEHKLSSTASDKVTGNFTISGEYKMTDASINREKFDFSIPFDIELDGTYKKDTIVIDIDNFYYELINNDTLEVNIDVYVIGEKEENKEIKEDRIDTDKKEDIQEEDYNYIEENISKDLAKEDNIDNDEINIIKEAIKYQKPTKIEFDDNTTNNDINIDINNTNVNSNTNNNIFDSIDSNDTYVTYYVYMVHEDDTIDKIIEKFNTTKEELEKYNDISNIKKNDKLIIPSSNE